MPDSISENGGVSAVTAKLPVMATDDLTVTVNAEEVSPAVSTDFELSQNTVLMIATGDTTSTGTVEITAVDNNAKAADKMITVTATVTATGNTEISPTTPPATLTITDDEKIISRFVPLTLITFPQTPTGDGMDDRAALVALYNGDRGAELDCQHQLEYVSTSWAVVPRHHGLRGPSHGTGSWRKPAEWVDSSRAGKLEGSLRSCI